MKSGQFGRWTTVIGLAACVSASGALGQRADTARVATTVRVGAVEIGTLPPLARVISVTFHRMPLPDALRRIAEQGGVELTYAAEAVPAKVTVTMALGQVTVRRALQNVLQGTGLELFVSDEGHVAVAHRASRTATTQQGGGTIAGRVLDAVTHFALDQVAVRVEGPGLGGVTTSDGHYAIRNVPSGTYRVTARRVGYTPSTKTVNVADSAIGADFALMAAPTKLNEVVTTAVGDQRRYEVGNDISTINADSIAPTAPITSLTDLISARAPGVTVEETSGLTGSGETIRIRGQSSLLLQGDPIVVVDGVRQDNGAGGSATLPLVGLASAAVVPAPSRLNDLNFADIQSIDVLKGPAASTEYGTDAANGVLVITTRHGTAGHPQWQASAEQTASEIPARFPTLYYSWGHTADASRAAVQCPLVPYAFGSGYGSATGSCTVDSVTTWDPLNSPSYSIFGTGSREKYGLSVSGGTETARYFVSGGLSNETGMLRMPDAFAPEANALGLPHSAFDPNGEDQRSVRANTAMRLGSTADLTVMGAYLSTYQDTPNSRALYGGITATAPLRDSTHGYGYGSYSYFTPVYQFGLPNSQTTDRLTGGLAANWRPTLWLVGHGTVGVDHGSQRATEAVLPQIAPLGFVPAQVGVANLTADIYTVDLRASATAAPARTVRAVTSVGLQLTDARTQGVTAAATGITSTNMTLNGAVNPAVTQLGNRQATLGGYGEEQIGFADRLFLTGALRVDAGSGFGHAYSTAVYPKASVSWLAATGGPVTVRLRGAFGESGVQPPNGSALQLYAPTSVWRNGGQTTGVQIANVQNQLLRPERSEEYEAGVDIGIWQNRVSVELTGYSKTTRDALVSTGTGWDGGGLPYEENVGQVRNEGIEGALTSTMIQTQLVLWDVMVNASVSRNKLQTLAPGIVSQQFIGSLATYRFAPGYPLYGYWAPQVQHADANHDGVLEPSEVTVANTLSYVGSSLPTREVSLGTHLGLWGGMISINALVDYRGGFRLLNGTALYEAELAPQSDRASNVRTAALWQQARDVAAEAILATGLDGYVPPAGFYEDATYARFRELSVTYAISRTLVRALHVRSASVTGAVRNLALWTRYTGVDPEATNSQGYNTQLSPTLNTYIVNNNMREDDDAVPLARYWVVRLNVGI